VCALTPHSRLQIEVRASTVNAFDARVRRGDLRTVLVRASVCECVSCVLLSHTPALQPFHVPMSIAQDFSGTVLAVGAGVRQFRVGDDVFGRLDDRQVCGRGDALTVCVIAVLRC
jgi:NADPH:quinone reductase-like Zn-dependent oxidoreductase